MPKRNKDARNLEVDHKLFVRIPALDYAFIRSLAHTNHEPMSAVIRRALKEYRERVNR